MSRVAQRGLVFLVAAAVLTVASSCRREAPSNIDTNKAPETILSRAPAESSLAYYRFHFYWSGADPDGDVAYYEIAVTDSNRVPGQDLEEGTGYTRTLRTDSLFILKADPPVENQIIGKRLYVRAVDNEGKVDPTPARAFFETRNDYYPEVVFRPGSGRWTDKCDQPHDRVLTSFNAQSPTDTIGLGAHVHWSWGGRDLDPDGSVVEYEYKLGSQPRYARGTAADTTAEYTFPAGSGRVQLLQVRAIDDGGLRSDHDFYQSVVVNFDPITWVVDPDQAEPRRRLVFQWGQAPLTLPSGATLPDNQQTVDITYTGFDDSRDVATSCLSTNLSQYQSRVLFRDDSFGSYGGSPFANLTENEPYPTRNKTTVTNLISGDNLILIRSIDLQRVADSTPESILVRVNYSPYFVQLKARARSAPEASAVDLLALGSGVATITVPEGDSLLITALGSDRHLRNPTPGSLEDLFDPNDVLGDELSNIASEGYRVYLSSTPFAPGFRPTPPGGAPYTELIGLPPGPSDLTIRADVKDQTVTNPKTGRIGSVVRTIRIVR